jgi:hypothetical protein
MWVKRCYFERRAMTNEYLKHLSFTCPPQSSIAKYAYSILQLRHFENMYIDYMAPSLTLVCQPTLTFPSWFIFPDTQISTYSNERHVTPT